MQIHNGRYKRLWDGTGRVRWSFSCSCGFSCVGSREDVEIIATAHDLNQESTGANAKENNKREDE